MFDRAGHGSGLIVWHFDYHRRSNTYFGSNDAQNDSERYQMDVEEFDQNDNTQELQRNETRGGPEDYLLAAATGITSGTRQLPPGSKPVRRQREQPDRHLRRAEHSRAGQLGHLHGADQPGEHQLDA